MKNQTKNTILLLLTFLLVRVGMAQEAATAEEPVNPYVEETFRSFYLVNGQSVEPLWKGDQMLVISHRFHGTVEEGIESFFGLDQFADLRLGFGYGLTDNFTLGFGRTRTDKTYDLFAKYRLLRQKKQGMPITVTLFGSAAAATIPWSEEQKASLEFKHRLSYVGQALLASKISNFLSVQLMPTVIHRNLTQELEEENTTYALGAAAKIRVSNVISIVGEYYQRLNAEALPNQKRYNNFGFSIDFSSSARHAFQLQFTNSKNILETTNLPGVNDKFGEGGVHFGFHVVRRFGL